MTAFQLIPLFAAIVNFVLAAFVCTRDLRLRSMQIFLLWVVSLGVWNLGAFFLFWVTQPAAALFWARVTLLGVIWLPVAFFHVAVLITAARIPVSVLRMAYVVTLGITAVSFSPLLVEGVRRFPYGAWFSVAGPLFYVYALGVFPLLVGPAFLLLVRRYRNAGRLERRKLGKLLVADAMLAAFGLHDMAPIHGLHTYPFTTVPIYPLGSLAACVYGLIVGHALLQDQLLDMRISLGKQAATILRLLFLLSTTYILLAVCALLIPDSFSVPSFLVSLLALGLAAPTTAYFFPRLLGAKSETLEMRILGDRFEYEDQVKRFTASIHSYTQAEKLVSDAKAVFYRTMGLSSFELFVLDPSTHETRMSTAAPDHEFPPLSPDSPLIDYFVSVSSCEYLDCRNRGSLPWAPKAEIAARAALGERKPEIVYPLRTSKGAVIGVLLCGNKDLSAPLTTHDLELLLSTCKQMGYAFERMHLSEQASVSERLDTLAWMSRGLAHDLPNAVMPITTFLEIESSGIPEGDERFPLLQLAKRNTANILAYAREAMFFVHDFQLRYAPVDVEALLENVMVGTASRAERRGVTVAHNISRERGFEADTMLLQRMLGNLVSNACDASVRGGTVTVNFVPVPDTRTRSGWVRFEVVDRGTGIAAEHLNHIFDPYYSTKQVGDAVRGFGLGLTIVQKIVLLHHGTINVRSEVGQGTTFTVDLPPGNSSGPSAP